VTNSTTWRVSVMTALYFLQGTNWFFSHYSVKFKFWNWWNVILLAKILTILWTKMSTPWDDKSLQTFRPHFEWVQSNSHHHDIMLISYSSWKNLHWMQTIMLTNDIYRTSTAHFPFHLYYYIPFCVVVFLRKCLHSSLSSAHLYHPCIPRICDM